MYLRTYVYTTYVRTCVCPIPFIFHVAFTELQTDMELVYDRSDQHLPFLDFRTFAMRVLFPHDTEHVVLQPLTVSGRAQWGRRETEGWDLGVCHGVYCVYIRMYVCMWIDVDVNVSVVCVPVCVHECVVRTCVH